MCIGYPGEAGEPRFLRSFFPIWALRSFPNAEDPTASGYLPNEVEPKGWPAEYTKRPKRFTAFAGIVTGQKWIRFQA